MSFISKITSLVSSSKIMRPPTICVVDVKLSDTSSNPVQNKAVTKAITDLKDSIVDLGSLRAEMSGIDVELKRTTKTCLTPGILSATVDNYTQDDHIGQWCQHNIKSSRYLYDISGDITIRYEATGNPAPRGIRLLYYDENLFLYSKTDISLSSEYVVPEGAMYVNFVLYYDDSQLDSFEGNLCNISFSFLKNHRIPIDKDMRYPDGISQYWVNLGDYSNSYVEGDFNSPNCGKYYNTGIGRSICIPYSLFRDYDYVRIKQPSPTGKQGLSRIHFLKKEPKANEEVVEYSDYYVANVPISQGSNTIYYRIPEDARYIIIYAFWKNEDRRPEEIVLCTSESMSLDTMSSDEKTETVMRNPNLYQFKLMHWNIGNYSRGGATTSIHDTHYEKKLNSFRSFIEKYKDYNILINEWNPVFARLSSGTVYAGPALWDYGYNYRSFVRCNDWDELGCVSTNTQVSHRVGELRSLAGMRITGDGYDYYAYPKPYVIYRHYIGGGSLFILHTHLPTRLTKEQSQKVFAEMVSIMSGYFNVVICGDFNIYQKEAMQTFIDAGYTVPNYTNTEYTYPWSKSTYDWFAYRGNFSSVEFKVCREAVEAGYEVGDTNAMLSDHWPIALTINYAGGSIVPGVKGAQRFNPQSNQPEWHDGTKWVSYNVVPSGHTEDRPADVQVGCCYLDTTLGKPIYNIGHNRWVDGSGNTV